MKRYLFNLLLALDQFVNAILLGDPDETLSSRCGKKHPKAAALIDRIFAWDPRHCVNSAEPDEGQNALTARDRVELLAVAAVLIVLWVLF